MVTTEAQVKVFTHVAVDPAAYNKPLAMIAGIFHVYHLMVILVAFRLGTTWFTYTRIQSEYNYGYGKVL